MRGYPEEISERLNEIAVRVERIRDYVPEEEYDETAAVMLATDQIARFVDNGK